MKWINTRKLPKNVLLQETIKLHKERILLTCYYVFNEGMKIEEVRKSFRSFSNTSYLTEDLSTNSKITKK